MDFAILLALLLIVGSVLALWSGDVIEWAREEVRRMRAGSWESRQDSSDPRCLRTAEKLARAKAYMRARGIRLLIEDRPTWQRINPMGTDKPAKTANVRPIRARPH